MGCELFCPASAGLPLLPVSYSLPYSLRLDDINLVPIHLEPAGDALKVPVCLWRPDIRRG